MRKALFAIVLVSASFAGGAVVNGPGLRWAQTMVLEKLGIESDDDIAASTRANASAEAIPSRAIPPLVIEPGKSGRAVPVADTRPAAPKPPDPEPLPLSPPPSSPDASLSASRLPAPTPTPTPDSMLEGPPAPEPIPPLAVAAHDSEPATPPPAAAKPATDQARIETKVDKKVSEKDRNHDPDPAVRRASASTADDEPGDTAASAPTGDWAAVRETMRGLGVSRYGIEGDPSGRVRFYCVIPLAGRRAVGQHFEAEGDDDLQAARAALKRVALWKATEGGANTP